MAELIDRAALLAAKLDWCDAEDAIRAMPTVDAEPVVRCKNCRWAEPIPDHAAKAFDGDRVRDCTIQRGDWKMAYGFSVVAVDGYCDEGERMDADHIGEVTEMVDADAPERAEEGNDGRA